MGTGAISDREAITAALDRFEAAQAEVAALAFDVLTAPEVLNVKDRLETVNRRQAAVDHRLTHQLTAQASPADLSAKSWTDALSNRLRIGRGEARRRLDEADDLGPRTTITGQPLQPVLPNVAAAQADGMSKISGLLDPEARATIDAVLAKWASPGMCNPDDDTPCVDGQPSQAAIEGDTRSQAQRNHDALNATVQVGVASEQPPPEPARRTHLDSYSPCRRGCHAGAGGVACRAHRTAATGVGAIGRWAATTRWYRRRRR